MKRRLKHLSSNRKRQRKELNLTLPNKQNGILKKLTKSTTWNQTLLIISILDLKKTSELRNMQMLFTEVRLKKANDPATE